MVSPTSPPLPRRLEKCYYDVMRYMTFSRGNGLMLYKTCRFFPPFYNEKSCYDIGHICPIRTEISTYEHWENVFILLFVLLVVIGFRQNHFHIMPNFRDFGAKMSFFRYIINQKRKIFIKHCSPRCSKTPLISEMCIYITNNLCKWGLGTPGERCSTD